MRESYRLYILKKISELLEGINPENGYDLDLRCKVYRGRMIFGNNDAVPMLSIVESTQPTSGQEVGIHGQAVKREWPLFIQGWVENDTSNPSDPAYSFMADVEHRLARLIEVGRDGNPLYPNEYLLGQRPDGQQGYTITSLRMGPGVVRPPANQVSSEAFFFLPIWVGLAEKVGQPYVTQPSI